MSNEPTAFHAAMEDQDTYDKYAKQCLEVVKTPVRSLEGEFAVRKANRGLDTMA